MLFKVFVTLHVLSALYVRLNQNKDLIEIFPFHSKNYRKVGNMRTGTKNVNPLLQ